MTEEEWEKEPEEEADADEGLDEEGVEEEAALAVDIGRETEKKSKGRSPKGLAEKEEQDCPLDCSK